MNSINPKPHTLPQPESPSKTLHFKKLILVALIVSALAVLTFFTAGTLSGLIAAGAAGWKIAFATFGCVAAGSSLVGSVYFAFLNRMFENTHQNGKDALNYVFNAFGSICYLTMAGVQLALYQLR